MATFSRSFLWLLLAFAFSNSQQIVPFGSFQHDIAFPKVTGTLQATSQVPNQQRQLTAGININPTGLPLLHFPLNPLRFPAPRNVFTPNFLQHLPTPPPYSLFIPNTIKQRPETKGQEEEYRKYLKEGEEEAEKEKQQNEITSIFEETTVPVDSLVPTQKTFVSVNLQGSNYSYTT